MFSPMKSTDVSDKHVAANRACCLLHVGFLPGLLLDPEDGGDVFLQNDG
jgi:hypothetical protein